MSPQRKPIVAPRHRRVFATLFLVFVVFGTSMTVVGATLPRILDTFGWEYVVAGAVLAANSIAYFSFTFVGGHLVKHWGPRLTMALGLAIVTAGLTAFAANPDPWFNIAVAAVMGIGQGGVEIAVNWSTLRLDPDRTGRPMNLMHGAFAVGAILGPLALGAVLQAGFDWVAIYRGMAVAFGLLAVWIALAPMPLDPLPEAAPDAPPPVRLSRHPAYWLSFLALFFYVGVEIGLSNWIAQYFVTYFAYPATASALLVSLFWLGLLAGRFGVPVFFKGDRQEGVLVGFSLLATLTIVALSLLSFLPQGPLTEAAGLIVVALAGFGCSIYYPAVITLLGEVFPQAQSQAIGFAATGGGVGAFAFPFLMSALAQGWGLRAGFATYAVFAVAMTAAAWGLTLFTARPDRRAAPAAP